MIRAASAQGGLEECPCWGAQQQGFARFAGNLQLYPDFASTSWKATSLIG